MQVELVRAADGATVEQWAPGRDRARASPQTVQWDGTVAGEVQRDGLYQFRVTATDASGAAATSSTAGEHGTLGAPGARASEAGEVAPAAPGAFKFLRYRFPLIGAHDYAEAAARFGGGRGHQGQDVFAACGTPIVAARGGVVKFKEFQSRAGNYVVIDGARTGVDFGYMHMREAALVRRGRPRQDRAADRLRRRHRPRQRLPPALRGVDARPAGTAAAARSIPCPTCRPGTRSPNPQAAAESRARPALEP